MERRSRCVAQVSLTSSWFQSEKVSHLTSKLDQLTTMNKKQDLLDMELEEAETR